MKESETNVAIGVGGPAETNFLAEANASTEIKSLTERKINVPDRIVLHDGKKTKIINFESCEPLTYLKLCIDLNFCSEEGMI